MTTEPLLRNGSTALPSNGADDEALKAATQLIRAIHGLSQLQSDRCLAEIHVITFERIEAILGATWSRLRHRILPMVQQWIEAELGGGDTVVNLGDSFCILYARLRGREAEARTEALDKLVCARLFGTEDTDVSVSASMERDKPEPKAATGEAAVDLTAEPATAVRPRLPDIEFATQKTEVTDSYLPLWSASRQAVSVFSCVPAQLPTNRLHYYDPPSDGPDIDRTVLNRALENILELHGAGESCFLMVSFNFNSLNRQKNRRPYELMLREIPKELRGLFIARIVRLPPGTPSMSVPPAVAFLRTYFQRVFVHLSIAEHDLTFYGGNGLGGVGISLRAKGWDNKLPDSASLSRFVAIAKRFRMPTYVEGVANLGELNLSRAAGFDLFGGSLISSPLKRPVKAYKLNEETIVSDRGGGKWVVE
jgi:hypothetical protein